MVPSKSSKTPRPGTPPKWIQPATAEIIRRLQECTKDRNVKAATAKNSLYGRVLDRARTLEM